MIDLLQSYWQFFLLGQFPYGPIGGISMTLILSVLSLLLAFPIGLALGSFSVSTLAVIRVPVIIFCELIRATPLLMIIFWIFFLLPQVIGYTPSAFLTAVVSLVIFEGAYIAVIIRAGINALPKSEIECALSLGFKRPLAMILIILPQVIKNVLPSLIGEFVSIIRLTSLGYVVGLTELTFTAEQINAATIAYPAQVYAILAIIYFVMCHSISRFAYWLEKKLS